MGGFAWLPRGIQHTFANASAEVVKVVGVATPGGVEDLFLEQTRYLIESRGRPDPQQIDAIGRHYGCRMVGPQIRASGAAPA